MDGRIESILGLALTTALGVAATVTGARAACVPALQWAWDGAVESPDRQWGATMPVVVQLTDDNGDGVIAPDDDPDVVFLHWGDSYDSVLSALDGPTGAIHWTTDPAQALAIMGLAAADIDGDGVVELIANDRGYERLVAFEHTGDLKWVSDPSPQSFVWGDVPSIADLDGDGSPEIIVKATVFDADGRLLWSGTEGLGSEFGSYHVNHAVDLDPDRDGLEILAGYTLYDRTGAIVWSWPALGDGRTAVADFDLDGVPEVVHTNSSQLRVLDGRTGLPLGPALDVGVRSFLPQPLIADIDGDGGPEIVVTNGRVLQALEWWAGAFSQIWEQPVDDFSGATAPSAYDLDGDGAADVIYHDEHDWYIFDGPTGAIRSVRPFSSFTLIEAPVVANIDDDCAAEILVGGYGVSPGRLEAYECVDAPTPRRIWNQYGYHATNVLDDGRIPVSEPASWLRNNDWMVQSAGSAGPTAAAAVPSSACSGTEVTLDAAGSSCGGLRLEYRWLDDGGTPVCDWSDVATCAVTIDVDATFVLEVRCDVLCEGILVDAATVDIQAIPDVRPGDLGNTLRAVRRVDDVELTWAGVPDAALYRVFRGLAKGPGPWPLAIEVVPWTVAFADVPGPPDLYLYRVAGVSCSGVLQGP